MLPEWSRALLLAPWLLLSACGTSASTPGPQTPPPGVAAEGSCAADAAWLRQVLGDKPYSSVLMRFDVMRRSPTLGPMMAKAEAEGPVVTFNQFSGVRRSSEESYTWEGGPGAFDADVLVLRQVSVDDPRSLDNADYTPDYLGAHFGPPTTLPSGVLESPPTVESQQTFGAANAIYVFPDRTWVQVEDWMMPRFRAAFSASPASPPLPAVHPDVAWEVCGDVSPTKLSLPADAWTIAGDQVIFRLFGSREDADLVYTFASPGLAIRAEGEQRLRCARTPCSVVKASAVEGSLVRYTLRAVAPGAG